MECENCARNNDADANYCSACGMRLLRGLNLGLGNHGERCNLTVLFSDLVGSTQLSANLDPEQWHLILTRYQQAAADAISEFGGHVGKFLGDGVMAYFGYPRAREDSAERAVNAGLKIVAAIKSLHDLGEQFADLEVRVGIHAGPVVVAPLADVGAEIFGDVPNISAYVQSVASPNSVVMTKQVCEAVTGKFVMQELGMRALNGIGSRLELFKVHGVLKLPDVSRVGGDLGQNPIIGRDKEVTAIGARFDRARRGETQFVLISGEAGIGKSRLLEEVRSIQTQKPCHWIECAGRQLYSKSPFHAAIEILRRGFGFNAGDQKSTHISELENSSRSLDLDSERLNPTLFALAAIMGQTGGNERAFLKLGAEKMREQVFDGLKAWIRDSTQKEFVTLVFEDLQWIDPSTLELVKQLVAEQTDHRLLIIATARPEFSVSWPMMEHHLHTGLEALDLPQARELIVNLFQHQDTDHRTIERIVSRSEGVPLFAEALVHLLSGDEKAELHDIPYTLPGSLAARVDSTGEAKLVAQLASVIGREFNFEILRLISELPEHELKCKINQLLDANLIGTQDNDQGATYSFTHALLRDAAYSGLLKRQRKILHRRVAEILRDRFKELAASHPQMLAVHWVGAEEYEHAWVAWKQTAKNALIGCAYREASDAYEQAIDSITKCPPEGRLDDEVSLRQGHVGALQISQGYSAPETQAAMQAARRLIDQTGDLSRQFTHIAGEWMAASSAAEYVVAGELAERLSILAAKTNGTENLATAKMILLTARYRIGNLKGADAAFRSGLKYFGTDEYRRLPGAVAQVYGNAAINAYILGDLEGAKQRIEPVLELAENSEHKYELAFSGHMASMFCLLMGEYEQAKKLALKSIKFAEQGDFPQFFWNSTIILGRAQSQCGYVKEGIGSLERGLVGYESTNSRAGLTTYLTWLGATQHLAGSNDAALATLTRALSVNPNERYYRPESLRARGMLHLELGQWNFARKDLLNAASLARTMGAKMFDAAIANGIQKLDQERNQEV